VAASSAASGTTHSPLSLAPRAASSDQSCRTSAGCAAAAPGAARARVPARDVGDREAQRRRVFDDARPVERLAAPRGRGARARRGELAKLGGDDHRVSSARPSRATGVPATTAVPPPHALLLLRYLLVTIASKKSGLP
jgi:hypothetical protein